MPPRLRINVVANAIGRLSSMVLAILFTPVYIHFLGIEAYGLIGFYITLQASITFLEMGLSRACNRELARHSGRGEASHQLMLDTLRSLEVIYWLIAILIGVILTLASSWIAVSWLNSESLPSEDISSILLIMAWVVALRWPVGLYTGALMGLQRQVSMNLAQVTVSLLNWGGSAIVLWLVSADVQAFFQWQMSVALIGVIVFTWLAWWAMPGKFSQGYFSLGVIKSIIPFVAGVGGNGILGVVLMQADKLILSAMLPLKQFGYYVLASVIANVAAMLASPVSNAFFPRFSQMIGNDVPEGQVANLYYLATQAVAAVIIPFALVIAFFSYHVLFAYTGDFQLAEEAATVLAILVVAKMLHASVMVPYALQLASGWVRLSLYTNIAAVIWLIPAIYWLTGIYGPVGASVAWLVVTTGYVAISIPLMHRRILTEALTNWIWRALAAPTATVSIFLLSVYWLLENELSTFGRWLQGGTLMLVGVLAMVIAVISAKNLRRWILGLLLKWR